MTQDFLPYGQHTLDNDDIAAVVDVLKNGPLTNGPKAAAFETAFAKAVGAGHAVVVSNGTTALHLALLVAGFQPGDVAIVPSVTFLSTANVVHMCGGTVVFADVSADTALMTPDLLAEAYARSGGKAGYVLPVHMTGQSEHMAAIHAFATEKGMKVITDCCHAVGARYTAGGAPGDGQFEDFGCYSLHPVKGIAMGEGGIITTASAIAAKKLRLLRSHDMHREEEDFIHTDQAFAADGQVNPWYYEMHTLGYNYRATDMQCALGLSQLEKLESFMERRTTLAALYDELFAEFSNFLKPNRRSTDCHSAWHLYAVAIDFKAVGKDRGAIMRELASLGIGTQVHYMPLHMQPYYRASYGQQNLPGAESYYAGTLSLPLFPRMQDSDPQRVVSALRKVLS